MSCGELFSKRAKDAATNPRTAIDATAVSTTPLLPLGLF